MEDQNQPANQSTNDLADSAQIVDQVLNNTEQVHAGGDLNIEHAKPWFRKKLFLIGLPVLIAVLGAGSFLLFGNKDSKPAETANSESTQAESIKRFGVAIGVAEGTVEYSSDGQTWQAVSSDTDLKESDSVRTGDASRAVLLIDDGSALRLDASSEVKLMSLNIVDVRVDNVKGQVYSRVVASTERKFGVYSDGQIYIAKGTAYKTVNTDKLKGVEVYHSTVEVANKSTDVNEGMAYYTTVEQKEKQGVISAIDLEALKSDEFVKWCASEDKKSTEFADKLGVLVDIDKPPVVVEAPKPTTTVAGITLKGSQSEYSAVFSWTVTGNIDVSKGYKLVRSKTSKTPTYPADTVLYIEPGKTSYTLYDGDGNTYNYRICAYRDGACDNYSNAVTVATKKKENPTIEAGALGLSISGATASWTVAGTAPNGFKLVVDTTTGPRYPDKYFKYKYLSETSTSMPEGLTSGTTYYVRVCKYTYEGGCQDYSNEVTYLAP